MTSPIPYTQQKARSTARYHARKDMGICPDCGGEPEDGRVRCRDCLDTSKRRVKALQLKKGKKYRPRPQAPIVPHPSTTTGQHYRVIKTGEIGRVVPCPGNDPLILDFKDKWRGVYHARDLEMTDKPITDTSKDTQSYQVSNKEAL